MENIGLIGVGNMGEAILKALLKRGYDHESILFSEINRDRAHFISNTYLIKNITDARELLNLTKYIIVAVKPQDGKKTFEAIIPFIEEKHVIISIMAGITISKILSYSKREFKLIRAMPNICAKIGKSVTGITYNKKVEPDEIKEVKEIFSSIGSIVEVEEEYMDIITSLSGSGPAFVLLFLEAMIDVVKGTVELLKSEGTHPTILKEAITSPGGTTIYGLSFLEEKGFKGSIIKAFEKAAKRAGELST